MGKPIRIVDINEDGSFVLNETALSQVLDQPDTKDLPVSVVSIAGIFRKGKSLMLGYFLRYLHSEGRPGWIGKANEPLVGFSWRGGAEADTRGILVWSKVFKMKTKEGEEFAVLLMDTQGTFDGDSTVGKCSGIFALSTMISSVQIYNLAENIGGADLTNLHLFTAYAQLPLEESSHKPFQKLVFLVRDWDGHDFPYGIHGGQQFLNKRLKISRGQSRELQMVRQNIKDCFTDVTCYLMPHPGLKVKDKRFNGCLKDMEPKFCEKLEEFAPLILHPDNHSLKQINGRKIITSKILSYFQSYTTIFNSNETPKPKTALEAIAVGNNLEAIATAKEIYLKSMNGLCCPKKPKVDENELEKIHELEMDQALACFDAAPKLGGDSISSKYRNRLVEEILDRYSNFKELNGCKGFLGSYRTKYKDTIHDTIEAVGVVGGSALILGFCLVAPIPAACVCSAGIIACVAVLARETIRNPRLFWSQRSDYEWREPPWYLDE